MHEPASHVRKSGPARSARGSLSLVPQAAPETDARFDVRADAALSPQTRRQLRSSTATCVDDPATVTSAPQTSKCSTRTVAAGRLRRAQHHEPHIRNETRSGTHQPLRDTTRHPGATNQLPSVCICRSSKMGCSSGRYLSQRRLNLCRYFPVARSCSSR